MSDEIKTSIKVMPNGPYKVSNISHITIMPSAEKIELPRGKILLCGCGCSETMPRCDGKHDTCGFISEKSDDRVPTRDKDYYGSDITVHFDLAVCAHVAVCVKQLRSVFNTKKRPWIDPNEGSAEDIIGIVKACPSGALSYTLKEQERVNSFDSKIEIIYNENGPFEIWGGVALKGCEAPKVADHYTLCSCGKSKNHPYCDGEHI